MIWPSAFLKDFNPENISTSSRAWASDMDMANLDYWLRESTEFVKLDDISLRFLKYKIQFKVSFKILTFWFIQL